MECSNICANASHLINGKLFHNIIEVFFLRTFQKEDIASSLISSNCHKNENYLKQQMIYHSYYTTKNIQMQIEMKKKKINSG